MTSAIYTNTSSKFDRFLLSLSNGATLSGISHIPSQDTTASNRPLLVAIHGGTCTSQYYDVSPEYTASKFSSSYNVPFIAIDRPGYERSTPPPSTESSITFWQATGHLFHKSILPTIWTKFGIPNGCTHLVTTSHSMGVAPIIVAAALYADDESNGLKPAYPFAGCIFSGFGTIQAKPRDWENLNLEMGERITFPVDLRDLMCFSEPELNLGDPSFKALFGKQAVTMPLEEFNEVRRWASYADGYVVRISIPVLFAVAEHDWLWQGKEDHLEQFKGLLEKSKRVDTLLVKGAPHAMELSYKSEEWYRKCFEWAKEVGQLKT